MKQKEKVSTMSLSSIKKKAELDYEAITSQMLDDDLQEATEAIELKNQEIQELKDHIVNLSMKLWKAKEQSCSCTQMPW